MWLRQRPATHRRTGRPGVAGIERLLSELEASGRELGRLAQRTASTPRRRTVRSSQDNRPGPARRISLHEHVDATSPPGRAALAWRSGAAVSQACPSHRRQPRSVRFRSAAGASGARTGALNPAVCAPSWLDGQEIRYRRSLPAIQVPCRPMRQPVGGAAGRAAGPSPAIPPWSRRRSGCSAAASKWSCRPSSRCSRAPERAYVRGAGPTCTRSGCGEAQVQQLFSGASAGGARA
jgi:hypothetical protein